MLNIPELERRWFQYKIKSYIPYLSITLSLVVIFIIGSFFYSYEESAPVAQAEKKVLHITAPQTIKEEIKSKVDERVTQLTLVPATPKKVQSIETTESKLALTPSLDFMKRMQNSVQPYYKSEETQRVAPKLEKVQTQKVPVVEVPREEVTQTQQEPTPNKINIRREDTQNDIKDIIKRFKQNHNPALSLFVAKKSYELGDYKQAYNYALMTNRINSDIESSWIVFAKSLVKLGKKEKAIATLKKYISYSNSGNAKILLDNIISGKFK